MNNEFKCKWLPNITELSSYNGDWEKYNEALYNIFSKDFLDQSNLPTFQNKPLNIRINPKENNFEHAFIHLTCTDVNKNHMDVNDRIPDMRRAERLEWVRKIVEHYPCIENCLNCNKIQYYEEYYKNNIRINLVFIDSRFKVIIEKREKYYLLITGYYLTHQHNIEKEIRKIEKYNQQKTPLV